MRGRTDSTLKVTPISGDLNLEQDFNYEQNLAGCMHAAGSKPTLGQDELLEYFDQMIKHKYPTETSNFEKMPRLQRNHVLKQMLQNEKLVVIPENAEHSSDGLPFMKIIESNLRPTKDDLTTM